jgi:hypothetical protein
LELVQIKRKFKHLKCFLILEVANFGFHLILVQLVDVRLMEDILKVIHMKITMEPVYQFNISAEKLKGKWEKNLLLLEI